MTPSEIIALIVTGIGVACFAAVFTILYGKYAKAAVNEVQSGKHDIELIDQSITMQDVKTRKRKKALSIFNNVLFYTLVAIVVPIFAFAIVNKVQGNLMGIGDNAMLVVASGSMSMKNEANSYYLENTELRQQYNLDNQFQKYDIIFLHKVDHNNGSINDIKLYDVIAFDNHAAGETYIHRVISIDYANDLITTRGDANNANDSQISKFADVKGVYTSNKLDGVGMIVMFFQSSSGIVTVLSVIYCLWMIGHYSGKIEKAEIERTQKLEAIIKDTSLEGARSMASTFKETIVYQGYVYTFDENGFVSKEESDLVTAKGKIYKKTSEDGETKEEVVVIDPKSTKETTSAVKTEEDDLVEDTKFVEEDELLDDSKFAEEDEDLLDEEKPLLDEDLVEEPTITDDDDDLIDPDK